MEVNPKMKLKEALPGNNYSGFVAVRKSFIGEAKNKSKFADMIISDGHSEMSTKQWDVTGQPPKVNTVIFIEGMVNQYMGNNQLVVSKWRNAQPGEYAPGQFIPTYPGNMEDLWEEYGFLRSLVEDEEYGKMLDHFIFKDSPFTMAPAAKSIHHAYLGGLFQHSISVAKLVCSMQTPQGTNGDLLITGALLHDLGKIEAYKWDGCIIEESDRGKLLGHISLGLMILTEYATDYYSTDDHMSFKGLLSDDKFMLLSHLIASHHGRLEWGSPVESRTKEAIILHHADMLSFQGNVIDKARAEATEGDAWTGKVAGLGREFWIGK
jgi:3'-5' exoribonuclease